MPHSAVVASSICIQQRLAQLDVVRAARAALVYCSRRNEVATDQFIRGLLHDGKRVAVPHVLDSARMEAREILDVAEWKCGVFGVPTAVCSVLFDGFLDLCVLPGLAFSPYGDRLGYGRGHWDRFFSREAIPCVIGVCHDWQVLDHLPTESTDYPADLVITEKRLFRPRCTHEHSGT